MKKILIFFVVILAILLLAYLAITNMPKASIDNKEASSSIGASALYNAFLNNEEDASTKYFGKVIEVSGKVKEIMDDRKGAKVVVISGSADPEILVTLEEDQKEKISNYKVNDPIKVKAQCNGMLMEVTMNKGVIID